MAVSLNYMLVLTLVPCESGQVRVAPSVRGNLMTFGNSILNALDFISIVDAFVYHSLT